MEKLNRKERNESIIKLHLEGFSYRDISKIIGYSKTTVNNVVAKIKNKAVESDYTATVKVKVGDIFEDKQTDRLQYIDIALRLLNIDLHPELLKKVVSVVDLVNKKGVKSNLEDVVKCSITKTKDIEVVSDEEARDNERLAESGFRDFIENED